MLQSKYTFKAEYNELAILCAHLKTVQERAVITPHSRPEGKSLELLLCAIIRPLAQRIDGKLFDYQSVVRFELKKQEALAFHCAYKYRWIPFNNCGQEIFETIDKLI